MPMLFRNGQIVFDGGQIVFLTGDPEDCRCCACLCPPDLHDTYTLIAPCISFWPGDACDGVDTWSVELSRPLPSGVTPPPDVVGDCVWYGENECGGYFLWLDEQCHWRLNGLADPKEEGSTPVGIYPNYLPGMPWASGNVEVVGPDEEEGI